MEIKANNVTIAVNLVFILNVFFSFSFRFSASYVTIWGDIKVVPDFYIKDL